MQSVDDDPAEDEEDDPEDADEADADADPDVVEAAYTGDDQDDDE